MIDKSYTYAQLCEAIEKAHGRITTPFSLEYPHDPRCIHSLRIYVACGDWSMPWYPAEDGDSIAMLLGIPVERIVAYQWDQYGREVLRLALREEE